MKNEQQVKDLLQIVVDAKNTTGTIQNVDFINLLISIAVYLVGEPKPTPMPEPEIVMDAIEVTPEVIE